MSVIAVVAAPLLQVRVQVVDMLSRIQPLHQFHKLVIRTETNLSALPDVVCRAEDRHEKHPRYHREAL